LQDPIDIELRGLPALSMNKGDRIQAGSTVTHLTFDLERWTKGMPSPTQISTCKQAKRISPARPTNALSMVLILLGRLTGRTWSLRRLQIDRFLLT